MAVYGISSNTIKELENKRQKFLREYENIVKAVCSNYKQKYIIKYEDYEKTWGTDNDYLNKQIKQGKEVGQAYAEEAYKKLSRYLRSIDSTINKLKKIRLSTNRDRGNVIEFDFLNDKYAWKSYDGVEPRVSLVGFKVTVETNGMYDCKNHVDPVVGFLLGDVNVQLERLDVLKKDISYTDLSNNEADIKGKELFRRILSALIIVFSIGTLIRYLQNHLDLMGYGEYEPLFESHFEYVLIVVGVVSSLSTVFSIKKKWLNNILPAALLMIVAIAIPIIALRIKISKIIILLLLLVYVAFFALKDYQYNKFYCKLSKENHVGSKALYMLMACDIVAIVPIVLIALIEIGLFKFKDIQKGYVILLPVMSILLLIAIIATVVNALKRNFATIESAYKQKLLQDPRYLKKKKKLVDGLEKLLIGFSVNSAGTIGKWKISDKGVFAPELTYTVKEGITNYVINGKLSLTNVKDEFEMCDLIIELNEKLGAYGRSLGNSIKILLKKNKLKFQEYYDPITVTVKLGNVLTD